MNLKFKYLIREIKSKWNAKANVIRKIVGANGTIP